MIEVVFGCIFCEEGEENIFFEFIEMELEYRFGALILI